MPDGLVIYGSRGCLQGDTLILDDGSTRSAAELFDARSRRSDSRGVVPARPARMRSPCRFSISWSAIASGRDPEASGTEGLLDLAAAFAICESSALGRPVTVDEVLDGSVAAYQAEIDRALRLRLKPRAEARAGVGMTAERPSASGSTLAAGDQESFRSEG